MADALTPEDRDMLAAEFSLGVLEGESRAQALRLQLSDQSFREAVADWELRLGQLYRATPEVSPPDLWPAIEARLPQGSAQDGTGTVVTMARRLQLWRSASLLTGAAAAALAILVVSRPSPQAPLPATPATTAIVAKLGEGDAPAQLVANYDPDLGELRIRAIQLPASRLSPELWVIPAGGAPSSLGLVAAHGATNVKVSDTLRALLKDGAALAVSLEPRAGAPHAAPSSTPIAVGTMHRL